MSKPQDYEYKQLVNPKDQDLNELASNGWEPISMAVEGGGRYVLLRRLRPEATNA